MQIEQKETAIPSQTVNSTAVLLTKSVSDEKRLATFLVLEPQEDDYSTTDLHEDWYDAAVVEDACHQFNTLCKTAYIDHAYETQGFDFVESYILQQATQIGHKVLKKGSWVATIKVKDAPEHQWIWDSIKSGEFNGLSIQAMGITQKLPEDN